MPDVTQNKRVGLLNLPESWPAPLDAHEEDECLLCVPAMNENGEQHAVVGVVDFSKIPLGEDTEEHITEIPVCAGHLRALERYRTADSVAEVDAR